MRIIFCLLLVVLSMGMPAQAQPLADRVPADAMVYLGWNGTDAMPGSYDASHFKAVVESSKVRELFTQFIPSLLDKVATSEPSARPAIQLFKSVLQQLIKHPTALYFAGIDTTDPRSPMPRIVLICKAGDDAQTLERQLNALLPRTRETPFQVTAVEGLLAVTVGYPQAAQALAANASSLAKSTEFTSALKQVPQPDPMLVAYIDYEKLLGMLDTFVQTGSPQVRALVPRVIEAMGLRGLKRAVSVAGFDGKDWMDQSFTQLPTPRTGLFEGMMNRPISADLLKAIPTDATFAAAGQFDPARLIGRVRTSAAQLDPQAGRMVEQVLGFIQIALGVNLTSDVLEPLGEDWVAYCSPTVAGNSVLGMVVVNKLDDPAKAARMLPIAWTNLSNWTNVALSRARVEVQITGRMTEIDGMKIYYAGIPILAPAWNITDGYLYMGFYPQSTAAAARSTKRNSGKSFTSGEKFAALQKRLGVNEPTGFSFYDLPMTAAQGSSYGAMLLLARYGGMADLFGMPLPEPLVPPLDVLQEHLTPAGSMSWVDDTGIHSKGVSPFPGSKMLSEPGMFSAVGPGSVAMMTSILLPSLNRARETANRVKCAANLKMLGQGILLFANENRGAYPLDLGSLIASMDLGRSRGEVLLCPSSGHSLPPGADLLAPDKFAAWANDNSDYVYMGVGMTVRTARADTIVIYEKPEDHNGDGINMLFGDGHVEFRRMPDAMEMIQRQMQRGVR